MAKQSGLHQIRGKVGEHSYYNQTGVASGLIRSINQGLSARVKTGEEYANTRLNMQEFGQACQIAGQLGKMVSPKFRPMVLPFSQSKMAKDILALIKEDTTAPVMWGWRRLMADKYIDALASLNNTAKYPFDAFVASLDVISVSNGVGKEDWTATVNWQSGVESLVESISADGVFVKAIAIAANYTAPSYVNHTNGNLAIRAWKSIQEGSTSFGGALDVDLDNIIVPVNPDANYHRTIAVLVMPYREIGGTKHILQEFCTFKVVECDEPA